MYIDLILSRVTSEQVLLPPYIRYSPVRITLPRQTMQLPLAVLAILAWFALHPVLSTAHPLPASVRTSNAYNGAPEADIQYGVPFPLIVRR